jgi:hypothetical protein
VLSPVIEVEPFADLKSKQLSDLNNQLKRINSRPDVIVETGECRIPPEIVEGAVAATAVAAAAAPPQKERRVSRFKVSVVTEPDRSKLVVAQPDGQEHNGERKDGEEAKKDSDYTSVINNTFDSLANILVGTLPPNTGKVTRFLTCARFHSLFVDRFCAGSEQSQSEFFVFRFRLNLTNSVLCKSLV